MKFHMKHKTIHNKINRLLITEGPFIFALTAKPYS